MPNEAVSTRNAVWGGGGQQDAVCDVTRDVPGRGGRGGAGHLCPPDDVPGVHLSRM